MYGGKFGKNNRTVKGAERMSRLIINYDDDIPTSNALHYVKTVVDLDRISGEGSCFCYVTKFKDGTVVFAETTKKVLILLEFS